jgi:hypothetical protein
VTGAIAAADQLGVGRGHGPINHFHAPPKGRSGLSNPNS